MTFLGLEKPVEYQRQQIFDPTTANMVLQAGRDYINAVYNDYRQGLADLKEWNEKFGDFISPIQKDMEWYDKNVTGKVRNFINNAYAQGIDPLRSAEGRAAVSQLIYSMPTGDIAKVRQSAEAAKEYIKNRGALEVAGKWDPDFERFANQGNMLEDWDTINGGSVWNRTSPAELKTLKELTEPWYNNRTAHILDKAGVESFGMQYDPRYTYTGFTEQDLLDIAAGQTPGWNGSIYSRYYRDLAKRNVQALKNLTGDGSPVTDKEIEQQLQRDVAIANREYKIAPQREADQFALDDYRTRNDMRVASYKKSLEGPDEIEQFRNVFREAEAYANDIFSKLDPSYFNKRVRNNKYNIGISGIHARYQPGEQYDEWVDPMIQSNRYIDKNKDTGETWEIFKFRGKDIEKPNSVYVKADNGEMHALSWKNGIKPNESEYEFEPEGNMVSVYDGNHYRYFIAGTLKSSNKEGFQFNHGGRVWIEAKEGMRRSMGRNKKNKS